MTKDEMMVTDPPPPRADLLEGTTAHYEDAAYYDRAYQRHRADINFYLQQCLEHAGTVLELGCGSGRVTLPLGQAGLRVVGVDLSESMLAAARAKLANETASVRKLIELRQGDIRSLALGALFDVVISPFNVMQHLYSRTDLEGCLNVVRRHLKPETGRFVFDVLFPDVRSLTRNPARRYKLGQVYHPARQKRVGYQESFDYDPLEQIQYITMYFVDPDEPEASFETPLCHRQFFPAEMEALLHYNGFEILDVFGEFDRAPLQEDSESQIFVCRLAE